MPYLRRNAQGNVTGISDVPERPGDPAVSPSDPELIAFLHAGSEATDTKLPTSEYAQIVRLVQGLNGRLNQLEQSDLDFIRVLEDLIDLLVGKELLMFSDLPSAAQQKLIDRRRIRDENRDPSLVVEGGQIL